MERSARSSLYKGVYGSVITRIAGAWMDSLWKGCIISFTASSSCRRTRGEYLPLSRQHSNYKTLLKRRNAGRRRPYGYRPLPIQPSRSCIVPYLISIQPWGPCRPYVPEGRPRSWIIENNGRVSVALLMCATNGAWFFYSAARGPFFLHLSGSLSPSQGTPLSSPSPDGVPSSVCVLS